MSNSSGENVRSTLLRGIQIEARNAKVYDTFAQLFQGYDDSVTAIFREMADEERQHGTDLEQATVRASGRCPCPLKSPRK